MNISTAKQILKIKGNITKNILEKAIQNRYLEMRKKIEKYQNAYNFIYMKKKFSENTAEENSSYFSQFDKKESAEEIQKSMAYIIRQLGK